MANAYTSPDRTAAYMQRLDENFDQICRLRHIMTKPGHSMADRVVAFAELYRLQHGDPHAQRRLVVDLEHTAKRQRQLEAM